MPRAEGKGIIFCRSLICNSYLFTIWEIRGSIDWEAETWDLPVFPHLYFEYVASSLSFNFIICKLKLFTFGYFFRPNNSNSAFLIFQSQWLLLNQPVLSSKEYYVIKSIYGVKNICIYVVYICI